VIHGEDQARRRIRTIVWQPTGNFIWTTSAWQPDVSGGSKHRSPEIPSTTQQF
jgi:hypothetical protein